MAENIAEQLNQLARTFMEGVRGLFAPTAVPQSLRDELGDEASQFAELFAPDPDSEHTGVMIAVPVPPDVAEQLAVEGGVPPEQMHITLAYLGDTAVLSDEEIAGAIIAMCRVARDLTPLIGKVGGVGRFSASMTSDGKDVIYAVVDVPGLVRLQNELVTCLGYYDVPVSRKHGFNPHITLAYVDPGSPAPESLPNIPLRVGELVIAVGGKYVTRPLTGYGNPYDRDGHIYGELAHLCARTPDDGEDDDNGRARLFFPFNFAEDDELPPSINYRPIPGVYTHPLYGVITLTRESNQRLTDNFNAGVYQSEIPIDAEHQTKVSGALGWIKQMHMNEDGSVDAEVEWTDRGAKLLKEKRFKYFSPEWYWEWCDPGTDECYADVATGGALTTRPFFKEKYLRPVISTELELVETAVDDSPETGNNNVIPADGEGDATATANTHKEIGMSNDTQTPAQDPNTQTPPESPPGANEPGRDGGGVITPQAFAEMQAQMVQMQETLTAVTGQLQEANEARAAAEEQATALQAANEKLAGQIETAEGRVKAIEEEARLKRFNDLVDGGDTGALWFGEPEAHISMLTTLAETFGEESEQFKAYVAQQEKIAEVMAMSDLFREVGSSRRPEVKTAEQKIEDAVAKLCEAKPTLTSEEAWAEVMESQPHLYEEYLAENDMK